MSLPKFVSHMGSTAIFLLSLVQFKVANQYSTDQTLLYNFDQIDHPL